MPSEKYHPIPELKKIIASEKKKGKTVALANGGFDLVHVGHVRYLVAAKKKADLLVVALNSDSSLKSLKGCNRPLIPEAGRLAIVSSFSCVDFVTLFDRERVDEILLALKPEFHCKGSDYTPDTVPEREVVKGYGGQTVIVGGPKIRSTSEILKGIKNIHED